MRHAARLTELMADDGGVDAVPTWPIWCIDDAQSDTKSTVLRGWLVRPTNSVAGVSIAGSTAPLVEHPRADLLGVVDPGAGNTMVGFSAEIRRPKPRRITRVGLPSIDLTIDGAAAHYAQWSLPPLGSADAIPPPELRVRVHGGDSLPPFLIEGYSAYRRLVAAIAHFSTGRRRNVRMLDWGVGCGRVSRYFAADENVELTGVDIDHDDIEWCRRQLRGRFEAIGTGLPMPFDPDSFDVVVGVSVMSHLQCELQLMWLEELRRLLVPGGIALLSTHGWSTVRRSGLGDDLQTTLRAHGYVDGGENPNVPESVVARGYYRNVFNTPKQIHSDWDSTLRVEAVIPGFIGNLQDLVVLRRTW